MKYGSFWILAQKVDQVASNAGHAIDHLCWRSTDINATIAQLKGKGVHVTGEPQPAAGGTMRIAFVEGPSGLRVELVQYNQ